MFALPMARMVHILLQHQLRTPHYLIVLFICCHCFFGVAYQAIIESRLFIYDHLWVSVRYCHGYSFL